MQGFDLQPFLNDYPGFENTFNQSFIGIPTSISNSDQPFYGTLAEAKQKLPSLFTSNTNIQSQASVIYMEGSGHFNKGYTFRRWIVEDAGLIFVAPNSFQSKLRPVYTTPASKVVYELVHEHRQAEIHYLLTRLNEIQFIDKSKLILMGNSEGGLAVARYSGNEFIGRIVLSWTCENGYYTDYPDVADTSRNSPFLNIVGENDKYFGKNSVFNKQYETEGHCEKALRQHKYAKVIVLKNTGHNVMVNPITKREVISFLTKSEGVLLS